MIHPGVLLVVPDMALSTLTAAARVFPRDAECTFPKQDWHDAGQAVCMAAFLAAAQHEYPTEHSRGPH